MATATQKKDAPAFSVKKFTGELPAVNGKERIPSPFDDVVAEAFKDGETRIVECAQNDDLRKSLVAQLHKSAKFVGCGLDLWRSLPEGIAFTARPKREGKTTSETAPAESNGAAA